MRLAIRQQGPGVLKFHKSCGICGLDLVDLIHAVANSERLPSRVHAEFTFVKPLIYLLFINLRATTFTELISVQRQCACSARCPLCVPCDYVNRWIQPASRTLTTSSHLHSGTYDQLLTFGDSFFPRLLFSCCGLDLQWGLLKLNECFVYDELNP
jgi:hypothetical protein